VRALLAPDPLTSPDGEVDLAALYALPVGLRHLRANFVTSVDGSVGDANGLSGGLSGPGDRALFSLLRAGADVVVVGAGTVRAEGYRAATLPIAVVSGALDLEPDLALFHGPVRSLVVTTRRAPASRLRVLAEVADVLVAGEEHVDLRDACAQLAERGLARQLCEGGPRLIASLAAADLVDELCLTTAPVLAGGDGPRLLVGAPPLDARLRLASVCEEDGFLFTRWLRAVEDS